MGFPRNFFSRLFGLKKESNNQEESPAEPSVPEEQTSEDSSAVDSGLPPTHPLAQLWSLRGEPYSDVPSPRVEMNSTDFDPIPMEKDRVMTESVALKQSLTRIAEKRIKEASEPADEGAGPALDALAYVHPSKDKMVGWLFLFPPAGQGAELTVQQLKQSLSDANITCGIDEDLLNALPTREDRYFRVFPIARGTPAINGENGQIIDRFSRVVERQICTDEFNNVDYTSLNLVQNVEEGDIICDIVPPTRGTPGINITGKVLSAKDGTAPPVPQGRNTAISEDKTALVSCCAGHLEFSGRTFQVKLVLDVPGNVDYSTGNIHFLGDVHIKGDVTSGFVVRATGNIYVNGVVEAATLEAGGDINVVGGVQGQDRAVLRAHQHIVARYLEYCDAYARESIHADCIVSCNAYSDGKIEVRTGRGTIIGGYLHAADEVSAMTVGSRAELHTTIALGGLPCEHLERTQIADELEQTEKEIARLEQQPDSPAKESQLSKLRLNLYIERMKLNKADKELSSEEDSTQKARLVAGMVYPGTVVILNEQSFQIEHLERDCTIRMVDGTLGLV